MENVTEHVIDNLVPETCYKCVQTVLQKCLAQSDVVNNLKVIFSSQSFILCFIVYFKLPMWFFIIVLFIFLLVLFIPLWDSVYYTKILIGSAKLLHLSDLSSNKM